MLRLYCCRYGRSLVSNVARAEHVTKARRDNRQRARVTGPSVSAQMKHRSPSEQHHGKLPRVGVPAAAASTSQQDGMEEKTPSNLRELTQNPLKKIWMPYKNGLPEKHISQRRGAYNDMATVASIDVLWCSAGVKEVLLLLNDCV